jgi:hypothetical protein
MCVHCQCRRRCKKGLPVSCRTRALLPMRDHKMKVLAGAAMATVGFGWWIRTFTIQSCRRGWQIPRSRNRMHFTLSHAEHSGDYFCGYEKRAIDRY